MKPSRAIPALLFALVLAAYAYFAPFIGFEGANVNSRFNLTYAIAEQGTLAIDAYHENTGDKAWHGGHYYSDKAPGPSLAAVPVYWLLKWVGVDEEPLMRHGLTLAVVGLPSAIAAVLFYALLGLLTPLGRGLRAAATLAYALGTLVFPFSTVFYGHAPAAAGALGAFFLLAAMRKGALPARLPLAALAGLLAGGAVLCDYPALLLAVLLTGYAAATLRAPRRLAAWLAGAALPLGLLLAYNQRCFGHPLANAYAWHVSYEHSTGVLGVGWPRLSALWGITFSPYRGLFHQSPFLLAALPGAWMLLRRCGARAEAIVCAAAAAAFLLFNAGYAYWDGVGTSGPRFLIPCLPFLALLAATPLRKWPGPVLALSLLSIGIMAVIAATDPRAEWRVAQPLVNFNLFLLSRDLLADNLGLRAGLSGRESLLPLLALYAAGAAAVWRLAVPSGRLILARRQGAAAGAALALALGWMLLAAVQSPFDRGLDQAESLFRYHRGRGAIPWGEVEDSYARLMKRDPARPEPYRRLAEIAADRGRPRLARAYDEARMALGAGDTSGAAPATRSPSGCRNVLLISIDALRPDHLGCYGYARDTSPNLDALARRGTRFHHAVSTTSWTLPAHMSLFTGLEIAAHGVATDGFSLHPAIPTLAAILQARGFATAAFCSSPYLNPAFGFARGFDTYHNTDMEQPDFIDTTSMADRERWDRTHGEVTSPRIRDLALGWLGRRRPAPFFLFLHFWDPHYDYLPPPPYDTRFDPGYTGSISPSRYMHNAAIHPGMDPRDLAHLVARYDGEIAFTDHHIGEILRALETLGLADDTLVVVTADHGAEFFEHGNKGHRATLYDETVRIPLIIHLPGGEPVERRVGSQAGIIDIAPTILDALGVPVPAGMQGVSLLPFLRGEVPRGFGENPLALELEGILAGLRTNRRKLLHNTIHKTSVILDLERDPAETHAHTVTAEPEWSRMHALWQDRAETGAALALLHRQRQPGPRAKLDAAQQRQLRSLGYAR